MGEKKKHSIGAWMTELKKAADSKSAVEFETQDGYRRSGRLTGLRIRHMKLNGRQAPIITDFELNDDPTDVIPMHNMASLDIFSDDETSSE